jgi:hypothetical protein
MNLMATAPACVVLVCTLVWSDALQAQRSGARAPTRETAVMIGSSRLDTNALNERLAGAGYPVFDRQYLMLGVMTSRPVGDFRLGAEVAGLTRPTATTADNRWRTQTGGGYAMFNVGYTVVQEGGLAITPKAGIGAGALTLRIAERDAPSFDEVLANPGRGVHLSTSSLLLDGSLAVRYRTGGRAARRAFLIGVRAGYTHSLLHAEWRRHDRDAPGGPTAGWAGPHFEVLLGRAVR